MSRIGIILSNQATLSPKAGPVVLGCRIRLARNSAGSKFPEKLGASGRENVCENRLKTLRELKEFKNAEFLKMRDLTQTEQHVLAERRLISRELIGRAGAAVVISEDQKVAIMLNEEDEFRIQVLDSARDLGAIFQRAREIDSALDAQFRFAFSARYGFLTACPTNLGSGMRASAMVHLPGLVMDGQMEKVVRALNMCGLDVRGAFGEGSDATGSIFQISNRNTLGEAEEKIVENLREWLDGIVEQEKNARRRVVKRDRLAFCDQIARAYGELRHAILLSENEAADTLSLLRMACDLGIFPEYARVHIDELFFDSQSAHVALAAETRAEDLRNDAAKTNSLRATHFRERFSLIPPPDFSAI